MITAGKAACKHPIKLYGIFGEKKNLTGVSKRFQTRGKEGTCFFLCALNKWEGHFSNHFILKHTPRWIMHIILFLSSGDILIKDSKIQRQNEKQICYKISNCSQTITFTASSTVLPCCYTN